VRPPCPEAGGAGSDTTIWERQGGPITAADTAFVPEGSFGILDNGQIPARTADWSNGMVAPMEQGALIATGRTHGRRPQSQSVIGLPN
jgi:hypothetical protein